MSRVFISYRRSDQDFVARLATDIQNAGHEVWLDIWRIEGREPFFDEIKKGIEWCTHFVFVVTPDSVADGSKALNELGYADLLKPHPTYVPVVALATPPTSFPLHIVPGLYHFHDFTIQPYVEALKRFLRALETQKSIQIEAALKPLAVMGTKGGIGKGTFVACSAQILAEAGYDVAIVDLDIDGGGSMRDARRRWPNLPVVKTVFDHIAPHTSQLASLKRSDDETLWDVTPEYLRDRALGRIWMIPAADEKNVHNWDVVPDLPSPREPQLKMIAEELLTRIRHQQPSVRFVLFDCGAGQNPIFSAGFEVSLAGIILVNPDPSYFGAVDQIKAVHASRFVGSPNPRLGIFTVANFVTSGDDIERLDLGLRPKPIAYIPRNPAMQEYAFHSPVDFDLGFDDVYRVVHEALQKSLEYEIHLPSEFEIRLARWWRTFLAQDIAGKTLNSSSFKLQTRGLLALTILLGALALIFFIINVYMRFFVPSQEGIPSFIIFGLIALCGGSGYLFYRQYQRKLLLEQSAKLGKKIDDTHREFLENLRKKDSNLLDYLNKLVGKHRANETAQRRRR